MLPPPRLASQAVSGACSATAQATLLPALVALQSSGGSSLTCSTWATVAAADAACLPSVKTAMLALVGNTTTVPAPYAPALTAQVNALLSNPCPSPPPPAGVPAALLTAVQTALVAVRAAGVRACVWHVCTGCAQRCALGCVMACDAAVRC